MTEVQLGAQVEPEQEQPVAEEAGYLRLADELSASAMLQQGPRAPASAPG